MEHERATALTYGGLAQAELMFCHFDRAGQWAERAIETADDDDTSARSAVRRVLGFLSAYAGDEEHGSSSLVRRSTRASLPRGRSPTRCSR